jgi:hypothetical protein
VWSVVSRELQATLKPSKRFFNWELLGRDWFGYILWCDLVSDTWMWPTEALKCRTRSNTPLLIIRVI